MITRRAILFSTAALAVALGASAMPLRAQGDYNDLQMAHVAVIASNIDIRHAHLALALSENADIKAFAETMIRDHSAVNSAVGALARKLNVEAQDNPFSHQLLAGAAKTTERLSRLRGKSFDRAYAANEVAYHHTVNGLVGGTFIPRIANPEVKAAFEGALTVFRGHEQHAEQMVRSVGAKGT